MISLRSFSHLLTVSRRTPTASACSSWDGTNEHLLHLLQCSQFRPMGRFALGPYTYSSSDFCGQTFLKHFWRKRIIVSKWNLMLGFNWNFLNAYLGVSSQGNSECKPAGFSVWVAGVSLFTWNNSQSNYLSAENSLNGHSLLTGGDWRLSGGKRSSLGG